MQPLAAWLKSIILTRQGACFEMGQNVFGPCHFSLDGFRKIRHGQVAGRRQTSHFAVFAARDSFQLENFEEPIFPAAGDVSLTFDP